jgi:outer membrane immunogenic protein
MYKVSKLAAGSVIMATAALGGASVALADGYEPRRVAYERPADWSGVYFGVQSGYQWSTSDFRFVTGGPGLSIDSSSAILGGHLGYQHQFGVVVVGVEASANWAIRDKEGSITCPSGEPCHSKSRLDDIMTIGGRLGWAAGHWMPYVSGGYASGRFEEWGVLEPNNAPATFIDGASRRHDGWYIGGGFEWRISPGWTTGLEYRHYEFDTRLYQPFTAAGSPVPGDNLRLDATTDTIMVRTSWRWGRPEAAPLK